MKQQLTASIHDFAVSLGGTTSETMIRNEVGRSAPPRYLYRLPKRN